MLISSKSADNFIHIVNLVAFEEISILYWGIKKMVESQTVRSTYNKLVASMSN